MKSARSALKAAPRRRKRLAKPWKKPKLSSRPKLASKARRRKRSQNKLSAASSELSQSACSSVRARCLRLKEPCGAGALARAFVFVGRTILSDLFYLEKPRFFGSSFGTSTNGKGTTLRRAQGRLFSRASMQFY